MNDIDDYHVAWVRHVPDVGVTLGAPGARDGVVFAVDALPDPQVRCGTVTHRAMAHKFDLPCHIAGFDLQRRHACLIASVGDNDVFACDVSDKAAIIGDQA